MKIVSFETAKLAKEKGFNNECVNYYNTKGEIKHIIEDSGCNEKTYYFDYSNFIDNFNVNRDEISAPYQYQLMDWLREECKIFITIYPYTKTSLNDWQGCVWVYIWNKNKEIVDSVKYCNLGTRLKYYEFLETALQEALRHI